MAEDESVCFGFTKVSKLRETYLNELCVRRFPNDNVEDFIDFFLLCLVVADVNSISRRNSSVGSNRKSYRTIVA